jgi:nitrate reductase NapE component
MLQVLQKCFKKKKDSTMERRNYFEPDNVILVKWVDKALLQSLKKKTIKLGFKVCGIWPLNSIAMVGKFGPNKVFIIIEEERAKNAYQSSAIENSNNSRD